MWAAGMSSLCFLGGKAPRNPECIGIFLPFQDLGLICQKGLGLLRVLRVDRQTHLSEQVE